MQVEYYSTKMYFEYFFFLSFKTRYHKETKLGNLNSTGSSKILDCFVKISSFFRFLYTRVFFGSIATILSNISHFLGDCVLYFHYIIFLFKKLHHCNFCSTYSLQVLSISLSSYKLKILSHESVLLLNGCQSYDSS